MLTRKTRVKMFINYSSLRDQYYDKVIDLYFHHHMSYRRIAEIIPVSRSGIAKWIRNFAGENPEVPIMRKRTVKQKRTIVEPEPRQELPDDVKALQAELLKVKEELRKERLRADAYDTMIDIAEDMFMVPIRKKLAPNGRVPACKGCQDLSGPGTLQAVWRIKAGILSTG